MKNKIKTCTVKVDFQNNIKPLQVPKMELRTKHLYKLYGYGVCKGKETPLNKVQETINFRYQKTCWCLVLVVEQFKGMTEFRVEIT